VQPSLIGTGPQAKACGSDGANDEQAEPWALAHGPSGVLARPVARAQV